ncbi:hypothetical protein Tco_0583603 [Tanacetum coccineum]
MSSASSAVTYTSVYTDSEPGRVFWGADEEISDGGIPRVIVYGYDGLPMQPVAPPSPDYIPGPEEPQTPPEYEDDETEDGPVDYPIDGVDHPTAESPGYVAESDPEEDPEEYEDDETEDGPVDYPMDGGDDGDDDDGDSSGDDADDEDEDEEDEEEEEEEHLAPADSAIVVPTVEPVSPPEGTEPVIPPSSTDISTTGARITVRLQASISLPPEAEVERLLAMPTPSPSPPISLLPPSAGERLARCTAPSAHSSPSPDSTSGTIQIVEEEAYASREAWAHAIELSQVVHFELQTHHEQVYAHESQLHAHQTQLQLQGTLIQTQHQAELLAHQMRARQPGSAARAPDHQEASRDTDSHIEIMEREIKRLKLGHAGKGEGIDSPLSLCLESLT